MLPDRHVKVVEPGSPDEWVVFRVRLKAGAERTCGILLRSFKRIPKAMWYLIEDFFEQGVVVKLFLALGWLAVVIMIASLINLLLF